MYLWLSLHYNKDKVRPISVSYHVLHLVQTSINTTATKTKKADKHTGTLDKVKKLFFLFFANFAQVLLASSFFSTLAQSGFVPVEWTPESLSSQRCGLVLTSNFSSTLATVVELIRSNDTASSLPKSCMEIKESSPVSPSGYYTISNGSGGSVVVYCNMDELYSCPSLEQSLKGLSNVLHQWILQNFGGRPHGEVCLL